MLVVDNAIASVALATTSAVLATRLGTGFAPAFVAAGLVLTSAALSLLNLFRGGQRTASRPVEMIDVQP